MKRIIHHIKKKSPHIKEQIAAYGALGISAIVLFFWVSSLGANFTSPKAKEAMATNLSPFSVLKDNLSAAVARTSDSLKAITNNGGGTEEAKTEGEPLVTDTGEGVVVIEDAR